MFLSLFVFCFAQIIFLCFVLHQIYKYIYSGYIKNLKELGKKLIQDLPPIPFTESLVDTGLV